MSTFREFANDTKHAYRELVLNLRGSRDPSPIALFQSGDDAPGMHGLDAAFFENDERRRELIDRFIVPMIHELQPDRVAWAFAGWHYEPIVRGSVTAEQYERDSMREEVITAVVIDREVHETWIAPLVRAPMTVGEWECLPPNEQAGRLVTPIQEALR